MKFRPMIAAALCGSCLSSLAFVPLTACAQSKTSSAKPVSTQAVKPAAKPKPAAAKPAPRPKPQPLPVIQMSQPNTGGPRSEFGANKQILRPNGLRLEGNAYIRRPEMDARADALALDYNDKAITEVRAIGNVSFRVDLPPKAGTNARPVHVEAKCAKATLDPNARVLTLEGNVDGFYQVEGGGKNTLSGEKVVIRQVGEQYVASGEGGVRVVIPAETLSTQGSGRAPFGRIIITAQSTEVEQKTGTIIFTGNARAKSEGGDNEFDVAAPSFTLTRGESGTISTLKTSGKTQIKIDLPADASTQGGKVGKPTRVEAIADSATVLRDATNTLILEGNVNGFYRLQPADAPAGDYKFNGDRAVIKYAPSEKTATGNGLVPDGLQVEVTGNPSLIQAPLGAQF